MSRFPSRIIRGGRSVNTTTNNNNENPNTPPTSPYNNDTNNGTPSEFVSQAQYLIAADVRMISGCHSEQTSADVSNIGTVVSTSNKLPSSNGKAGGACTSALLEILYDHYETNRNNNPSTTKPLSFQSLLVQLRTVLAQRGFDQIPQLSSSRPLDVHDIEWNVTNNSSSSSSNNNNTDTGSTARALLVGINYVGEYPGQLNGCHNDVVNMQQYLINVAKYKPENILVLMDDGKYPYKPTRTTIMNALQQLVQQSRPGDSVYFHYSGHGGLFHPEYNDYKLGLLNTNTNNTNATNLNNNNTTTTTTTTLADQYDEIIYPVDHKRNGHIRDFSLYKNFVQPMSAGVIVTCIMDCCHSGSVLQLPFAYQPTPSGTIRSIENTTALTNLAFFHILMGYPLPMIGGLFDSIITSIEDTTNEPITNYIGTGNDDRYDTVPDDFNNNNNNNDVDTEDGVDDDDDDAFRSPTDNNNYNYNDDGNDDSNNYYNNDETINDVASSSPFMMNRGNNNMFTTTFNNNDDSNYNTNTNNSDWVGRYDTDGGGNDTSGMNDNAGIDCGCVVDVLSALLQQQDDE